LVFDLGVLGNLKGFEKALRFKRWYIKYISGLGGFENYSPITNKN